MTEVAAGAPGQEPAVEVDAAEAPEKVDRVWVAMAWLVGLDFLLGLGAIITVPFGRPSGWLPVKGREVYLPHAVVGAVLVAGAVYLVARHGGSAHRITRLAARWGIAGIVVGAVGGLLVTSHPLRLLGMGLMLVGGLVAVIGYCMPSLEAHDRKERAAMRARFEAEAVDGPFG